jgi:hypothetical protein
MSKSFINKIDSIDPDKLIELKKTNRLLCLYDSKINSLINEVIFLKEELAKLKEENKLIAENPLTVELTTKLKLQELNILEQKFQYEQKLQDIMLQKLQYRCWC